MTAVKQYRHRLISELVLEAIQYDGTEESYAMIKEWVTNQGGILDRTKLETIDYIQVLNGGDWYTISPSFFVAQCYSIDLDRNNFIVESEDAFNALYEEIVPESNLVLHALRELAYIGEDSATVLGYIKIIQAFADMGHSGGSASVAIPIISRLLSFEALTPLTNNPDEWYEHSPAHWDGVNGVWQNKRDGRAFSDDAGRTYYNVDDSERVMITSVDYKKAGTDNV